MEQVTDIRLDQLQLTNNYKDIVMGQPFAPEAVELLAGCSPNSAPAAYMHGAQPAYTTPAVSGRQLMLCVMWQSTLQTWSSGCRHDHWTVHGATTWPSLCSECLSCTQGSTNTMKNIKLCISLFSERVCGPKTRGTLA